MCSHLNDGNVNLRGIYCIKAVPWISQGTKIPLFHESIDSPFAY